MSIDVEYAIKKDIRNNPIVREIDLQQKHEFLRTVSVTGLIVVMLIVWAIQQATVQHGGYALESRRKQQAAEAELNRKLRLEFEMLRSPQYLAARAVNELHMLLPDSRRTLIIERTPAATASKAIVASKR